MNTIRESLLAISAYPIPCDAVESICTRRGISAFEDVDETMMKSRNYRLAEADVMMWLFFAPSVSQGGQSYSLTDSQREAFRRRASQAYSELGDAEDRGSAIRYGYKGDSL